MLLNSIFLSFLITAIIRNAPLWIGGNISPIGADRPMAKTHGPGIASGLVSGAPQLGAAAAIGTAGAAAGAAMLTGGAVLAGAGALRATGGAGLSAIRAGAAMGSRRARREGRAPAPAAAHPAPCRHDGVRPRDGV